MGRFSNVVRRMSRAPGVGSVRHLTERAVAPYLRSDLEAIHHDLLDAVHRLSCRIDDVERRLAHIEEHQTPLLNAVASVNGNARLARREMSEIRSHLSEIDTLLAASVPAGSTID